jgi:hypothetical protein
MEAATTATATETQADLAEAASEPAAGAQDAVERDNKTGAETGDERDESGRYLSREGCELQPPAARDRDRTGSAARTPGGLRAAEVERQAGAAGLQVPGDVWTFGATLETLRGEDGAIDSEAVNGLVKEIVKDRRGLQAQPVGDLGIGKGAAAAATRQTPEVGLSALLKPGAR